MPKRPCLTHGCSALTESGHCPVHRREQRSYYDTRRGSSAARGYDARWQRARIVHLQQEPFCRACRAEGKAVAATEVDHIRPHKGDMVLFWNRNNWQSLCSRCHKRKTVREDGGFGMKQKADDVRIDRGGRVKDSGPPA